MNTLYELAKRIDALTANSQQVLNALIRSCVATGSSRGYSVRKYDRVIEMSRVDIYRLYDFYQSWEAAGFDPEKFDGLLAAADSRWNRAGAEVENAATVAVMKHSQMLYLTDTDKDREEPDYWTGKIRDSASGKATVATAPIPLNLRTPLYDENLSTKSFSQYETYLFPIGYQRLQILGTPNNGEDYLAGGRNWTIGVSDEFKVNADSIMLGAISNPDSRKVNRTYNEAFCTFSWGQNSYGLGPRTFAAGDHAIAVADTSFSLGKNTVSLGESSMAEGEKTVSVAPRSVAMNSNTVAGGFDSIAANQDTVTGGYPYYFTTNIGTTPGSSIVERCDIETLSDGEKACIAKGVSDALSSAAGNVIKVTLGAIDKLIRPGKSGLDAIDLKANDNVYVYMQYSDRGGNVNTKPYEDDGLAYNKLVTRIVSITNAGDEYIITLNDPIPTGMDGSSVTGGFIKSVDTILATGSRGRLGQASNAFNYNTYAYGNNQTVVGTSNLPDYDARFIVGTGSSYIYASDNERRKNGFVVAPDYSYLQTDDEFARFTVSKNVEQIDAEGIYGIKPGIRQSVTYIPDTQGDSADSGLANMAIVDSKHIMMGIGGSPFKTYVELTDKMIALDAGDTGNLRLTTKYSLTQEFGKLILLGNTYETLTADSNARSFNMLTPDVNVTAVTRLTHSGFYYNTGSLIYTPPFSNISWVDDYSKWPKEEHVIDSVVESEGPLPTYNGAALVLPGSAVGDYVPHIKFVAYQHMDGIYSDPPPRIAQELAYLSDLSTVIARKSLNLVDEDNYTYYTYYSKTNRCEEVGSLDSNISSDAMPDIDGTEDDGWHNAYTPTNSIKWNTRTDINRIGVLDYPGNLPQTVVGIAIYGQGSETEVAEILPTIEAPASIPLPRGSELSSTISLNRYGNILYLPLNYKKGPGHATTAYQEIIICTNNVDVYSSLELPSDAPDIINLRGVGIGGITATATITRKTDDASIQVYRSVNGNYTTAPYSLGGANYIIHLTFRIPNHFSYPYDSPITLIGFI